MDVDERDPDLVAEDHQARRALVRARRHARAWDEPPEYYDAEPAAVTRCQCPGSRDWLGPCPSPAACPWVSP